MIGRSVVVWRYDWVHEMFGKIARVNAKPSQTIIKADPVRSLRKGVLDNNNDITDPNDYADDANDYQDQDTLQQDHD